MGGLYGFSELLLGLLKRAKNKSEVRDRGSLAVLWGVIFGSMLVANMVLYAFPDFRISNSWFPIGCAVFFCGLIIRWYAILYLGRFFTVDVAIHSDHHVVDTGPYRFIRHPAYLGVLLAFLGLGLCMLNWVAGLLVIVPIASAFMYRIQVEEMALNEALGARYAAYTAKTKRLILFVY